MPSILPISLSFIVLCAIILYFVIFASGHYYIKATLISISLIFGILLYNNLEKFLGWPSKNLPNDFTILAIVIQEPRNIILLTQTNDDDIPRLFNVDYNKDLHKQLMVMQTIKENGGIIKGKKGASHKEHDNRKGNNYDDYEFYELPPPKYNEKTTAQ